MPDSELDASVAAGADEDLFADSFARVRTAPEDVANWQDLSLALRERGTPARREAVLEVVRAMQAAQPLAGYLRAVFLYKLTGDPQYLAQAGAALSQGDYPDRDRLLLTLLNLAWARALAMGGSRGIFLDTLQAAGCQQALDRLAADLASAGELLTPLAHMRPLSRVAVLAPSLGGFEHAPTALALNHAALLASMRLQAHVFTSQDMTVPHIASCLVDDDLPQFSRQNAKSWKPPIAGRFDVTFPDSRLAPVARWRNALRQIARFDPDVVLFVGLMSPLLPQIFAARPLVSLPVNSVQPLGPHDLWLAADAESGTAAEGPPGDAAGAAFNYPYRIALRPARAVRSRQALGLPEDALALISVGFRLNVEIRGSWAARMEDFLDAHPRALWLIVGSGPKMPPALTNRSKRIRAFAPQQGMRGLYRACDIYVNPPRMGGGFSVAEAMAEGMPVLAFKHSDGGAKAGEHALGDMDAYFARLDELARDAGARKALGAALAARFAANYDLNSARGPLARAMALARERYLRRSGGKQA